MDIFGEQAEVPTFDFEAFLPNTQKPVNDLSFPPPSKLEEKTIPEDENLIMAAEALRGSALAYHQCLTAGGVSQGLALACEQLVPSIFDGTMNRRDFTTSVTSHNYRSFTSVLGDKGRLCAEQMQVQAAKRLTDLEAEVSGRFNLRLGVIDNAMYRLRQAVSDFKAMLPSQALGIYVDKDFVDLNELTVFEIAAFHGKAISSDMPEFTTAAQNYVHGCKEMVENLTNPTSSALLFNVLKTNGLLSGGLTELRMASLVTLADNDYSEEGALIGFFARNLETTYNHYRNLLVTVNTQVQPIIDDFQGNFDYDVLVACADNIIAADVSSREVNRALNQLDGLAALFQNMLLAMLAYSTLVTINNS